MVELCYWFTIAFKFSPAELVEDVNRRLGIEKTMFEASNQRISKSFIKQYSQKVNALLNNLIIVLVFLFTTNYKMQLVCYLYMYTNVHKYFVVVEFASILFE